MRQCVTVLAAIAGCLAMLLAVPSSASLPAHELTRADVEAWLDGYMSFNLRRSDIAGAVVVVVKDAQVLLQRGYGYASVAHRTPVDPEHTLFRVGSVSKLFTATAVMQLVEQGKLDLDRDINDYLDFKIPAHEGPPITLRNLLTHSAGFEERFKGIMAAPDAIPTLEDVVKAVVPRRIYAAGQVPAYSNYGATLAGYIVQRVSGESFEDYIERHILGPLDMQRSTFRQPLPAHLRSDMSAGYGNGSDPSKPFELIATGPAGSLTATGADMARFMIAHLRDGALGSARILQPATAQQMHRSPLTLLPSVNRMMLGFMEDNLNGRRGIAHSGDTVLFHSNLHLFLDDGVGIFVSINSSGSAGSRRFLGSLVPEFADRYFPAPALQRPELHGKTALAHAQLVAGTYVSSRRSASSFMSLLTLFEPVTLTANADGTIVVSALSDIAGRPKVFSETAPFVWREAGGDDLIAARVVDGRAQMMTAGNRSPDSVLLPIPWWRPGWLISALPAALAVLLLTALSWPVGALMRRRYSSAVLVRASSARAYQRMWAASLAAVVLAATWIVTLIVMMSDLTRLSSKLDGWIVVLYVLSPVVFGGGAVIAVWNAWLACVGPRGRLGKLWSIIIALASLTLLWAAVAFRLIGFTLSY
jgi:CubicO group peptidase (beta-lactamase class C family)